MSTPGRGSRRGCGDCSAPRLGYAINHGGHKAGSTYPTLNTMFFQEADIVINDTPTVGGVWGWTCTAAGYPGTWVPIGIIPARTGSRTPDGWMNGN